MCLKFQTPRYHEVKGSPAFTNAASFFHTTALQASKLMLVWRVAYIPEAKEVSPRKATWFLKHELQLSENQVLRLV
eukprot:3759372-Alexandrium_andersonii.AAC.1